MGFSFLPLFLRLFTMTVADSHYTRTYVISFKYIYLLITLYKFFMKSIFRVNMINISKIILYFAYLSCNYASKEGTLFLKWVSKTIHSHDIFLSLSMEVHWSNISLKNICRFFGPLSYVTTQFLNWDYYFLIVGMDKVLTTTLYILLFRSSYLHVRGSKSFSWARIITFFWISRIMRFPTILLAECIVKANLCIVFN